MAKTAAPPPGDDKTHRPRPPVTSNSKVTVAFPFSTIRMDGDPETLAALAAIVADLASELVEVAPSKGATALQERARALAASLR